MVSAPRFPIEGISIDVILLLSLLLSTLVPEDPTFFSRQSYLYFYWSVGLLQCLALYSIFSGDIAIAEDSSSSFIVRILSPISGLILVLSLGAFIWIFIPADVVGAKASMMVNLFLILFGSWIAVGVALEKYFDTQTNAHRFITALIVLSYLYVSEQLLLYTALCSKEIIAGIIFIACLSYLPVRIMLLLRKPVHDSEALSALLSFGYFIYCLSQQRVWYSTMNICQLS